MKNKGITLIALVITIIVLIILAGVSINVLLGDNGLIRKANEAVEISERQRIKEQADMIKANLEIDELTDTTGTIEVTRETLVAELQKKFEGSTAEGYTVKLNNGYEIFVTEKEDIVVRKQTTVEEVEEGEILASHTIEKWQEEVDKTTWISSDLNEEDTQTAGVPVPVGFSILEGDLDEGLVIVNDTTDDEFVWIPVNNKAKTTVTFESKLDLKTVTGPTGANITVNGKTATVEFTTQQGGLYEFYAEDKNGNKLYYDVDIGGINLAGVGDNYNLIYRKNIIESQMHRVFYKYESTYFGYEIEDEKTVFKKVDPSLWENWDDAARGMFYMMTSLEDWYYNFLDEEQIIENATQEQMVKAFIDCTNEQFGKSATTFDEIKTVYTEIYYQQFGKVDTLTGYLQLLWNVETIEEWYEGKTHKETITPELQTSVEKYGGFYVGRYEAGSSSIRTSINADTVSNPIVQKNQYPYNYISQTNAQIASSNYEGKGNTTSHLLYGGEWDAILEYIIDKEALGDNTYSKVTEDSSDWGNYYNASFDFEGKYDASSNWSSSTESIEKPENNSYLLGTGVSERNKVLNIYDIAGNVLEWTNELRPSGSCVVRGGLYSSDGTSGPGSSRDGHNSSAAANYIGFRFALCL